MQFKVLVTLLPLLAAAVPLSSFSDSTDPNTAAIEDIQALKNDLTKLDNAVQKYDGQLASAMPLKEDATNAQEDVEKALKDSKAITSLTPEVKQKLTSAMRELKPEAESALQHLVEKEPQFEQSGLTQPIGGSLQDLKGSLSEVEQTFSSQVSGQEAQELTKASKEIGGELEKAIKAFSA